MKKLILIIAFLLYGSTAQATLIDRGSFAYNDGLGNIGTVNLIYDQDFEITWVGHGNFAQSTGFDADGRMDWNTADGWAKGLTIGGFDDWMLPTALNQNGSGPDFGFSTGSKLGHLFYGELGGTLGSPILSSGDPDLGLFPNLLDHVYWSGTEYVTAPHTAWALDFTNGIQSHPGKNVSYYALAVRDGDVAPVPEPSTIAFLGIGLVGLAGFSYRRRKNSLS